MFYNWNKSCHLLVQLSFFYFWAPVLDWFMEIKAKQITPNTKKKKITPLSWLMAKDITFDRNTG